MMRLSPGVVGYAQFAGFADEHRLWLERIVAGAPRETTPFALWLGMNPSTAGADVDDLTARKAWVFTATRLNLSRMVLCNWATRMGTVFPEGNAVMDWPGNLDTIAGLARGAARIVVATGNPPEPFGPLARRAIEACAASGKPLECLGTTQNGWPRHPSRLGYATPFDPFLIEGIKP